LRDSCGNTAPDQILVVDFLPPAPPVFSSVLPNDTTYTCEDFAGYTVPDLDYDNGETGSCQISGTVSGVINGVIDNCGGQVVIEWTFIDTCGRILMETQTITVMDDEAPVIVC